MRERVAGYPTIRPDSQLPWSTVGTAIDYRLRFYFRASETPLGSTFGHILLAGGVVIDADTRVVESGLLAGAGAAMLVSAEVLKRTLIDDFFSALQQSLVRLSPFRRRLDAPQEKELCRYCFVLALFEEVRRAGLWAGSPLLELNPRSKLPDLLKLGSAASIDDLCRMSWAFCDTQQQLIRGDAILNPVFEGSADIGGADADLIVDHRVIEVKTALDPSRIKKDSWPWQLLGYALLDYNEAFGITDIGLYLARQSLLVTWPLDEFAEKLAGSSVSLPEIRDAFRMLLVQQRTRFSPA